MTAVMDMNAEEREARAESVMTHDEYRAYIQSPKWFAIRDQVLERAGHQCERCRAIGVGLQVHHKNYELLGREDEEGLDDLEALCEECHKIADAERIQWANVKTWILALGKWAKGTYTVNGNTLRPFGWWDSPAWGWKRVNEMFETWLKKDRVKRYVQRGYGSLPKFRMWESPLTNGEWRDHIEWLSKWYEK